MKYLYIIIAFVTPLFAFAKSGTVQSLIAFMTSLLTLLIPSLFGLSIVLFFWGLSKYVYNAGDEKKEQEGRNIMTWGVLAIFVLLSIWGILSYMNNFLGNPKGPDDLHINLPQL